VKRIFALGAASLFLCGAINAPTEAMMFSQGKFSHAISGYATWNPADKNASITLSNGNLTVTSSGGTYDSVRSTISKSSGKWYFETTITAMSGCSPTAVVVGIATSSMSLSGYVGQGTGFTGEGYGCSGIWLYDNTSAGGPATFAAGDVIGVAFDATPGNITVYKNNVSQYVVAIDITCPCYAAVTVYNGPTTVTTNFGATAFAYTPPTGYSGLQ
jgi:hypothetical protein